MTYVRHLFFTVFFLVVSVTALKSQKIIQPGDSIIQTFDTMGVSDTPRLPSGWKADRLNTVRTVGDYMSADTVCTGRAGNNMSEVAAQGIYNFGAGFPAGAADRAAGWLSSSSGTKSGNLYFCFRNGAGCAITGFSIRYDVEKYRRGSNASGFSVCLFYSHDGTHWRAADSSFTVYFSPDTSNDGYTDAPGETRQVGGWLKVTIPAGTDLYLAWNYSVASGAGTSSAQAIGIDNISIASLVTGGSQAGWHFRSAYSGSWHNDSLWLSSADGQHCWLPADTIPFASAASVTIATGDTVILQSSASLGTIVIEEGAVLIYGDYPLNTLSLNDTAGTDLVINGSFYDSGPNNIVWVGNVTWRMGPNGVLVRTKGGTSSNNWRDHYEGGISQIPASAYWIVRKVDETTPEITSTGGMYYPNLLIENMTASVWATSGGSSFSGSTSYPRIKGNFDIGGQGVAGVYFLNNTKATSPVSVGGNLIIRPTSSLMNYGTGIEVKGDAYLYGIFLCDHDDARKFLFSGVSGQTIYSADTLHLAFMEINKPSGNVGLETSLKIDSSLVFFRGLIHSSASYSLCFSPDAFATGMSDCSYVAGVVKKETGTGFTFPTGDAGRYMPVSILSVSGTGILAAEYIHRNPGDDGYDSGQMAPALKRVSGCEYWMIEKTGNPSAYIVLGWDDYSCGVGSPSDLAVAHWNGTQWETLGNGGVTGNEQAGTVTTLLPVVSFSPFTLASTTLLNPLPVSLLSFSAKLVNEDVLLEWRTANEVNNEYFSIERSVDGEIFYDIKHIPGKGNSNTEQYYDYTDMHSPDGTLYYRLRQTDYNGTFFYSNIVALKNENVIPFCMYDNAGQCLIIKAGVHPPVILLEVFAITGQFLFSARIEDNTGDTRIPCPQLSAGIYLVKAGESWVKMAVGR